MLGDETPLDMGISTSELKGKTEVGHMVLTLDSRDVSVISLTTGPFLHFYLSYFIVLLRHGP